jgi:hypothetical protein
MADGYEAVYERMLRGEGGEHSSLTDLPTTAGEGTRGDASPSVISADRLTARRADRLGTAATAGR